MLPTDKLTIQESVILSLLARGQRNALIADKLCISIRTVETHLYHIFDKLGVSSRTEAAIYALRHGLISLSEISGNSEDI
ncbi:MAG TPA: LuxR C-terminal-related transcriptional regulator [Anaerolineales bacterium]|nr:LuxR C-terminal-related transcriptional regulator [Anaerolineales bacterium]